MTINIENYKTCYPCCYRLERKSDAFEAKSRCSAIGKIKNWISRKYKDNFNKSI